MQTKKLITYFISKLKESSVYEKISSSTGFDDQYMDLLLDPNNWELDEKERVYGDKRDHYCVGDAPAFEFLEIDSLYDGEINNDLVNKILEDWETSAYKENKKPWHYEFQNKYEKIYGTVISLDVFTTPDDKEIIGWLIDID